MGITVPTATIPSGIQLSNVYISLANEPVSITRINKLFIDPANPQSNANYQVNGYYSVYVDRKTSKIQSLSPIRIPIGVRTVEYPSNPHQIIYNQLKQSYSNVQDVYEVSPVTFSNLTVSGDTLVSLFKDINLDSNTYVIPSETSNIVITQDAFSQLSNAINSFQFTLVPEVETSNVVPEVETASV
jgi:ABC-type phosphate/phosphonate transport system substrate-binding protein